MRKYFLTSAALAGMMGFAGAAQADYAMTILHTNDFHSRIEPINKYDSTCSGEDEAEGKCFGGSARLATAIRAERAAVEDAGGNVMLVDGGDQFQGSLFYTTYKGAAAAEMMNRLGYDAMTVGNHEFDDGPEVLSAFIDKINFPILMANAEYGAEESLAGKLQGVKLLEKGGETVALVGIVAEDTDELSSPGEDVHFLDAVATLRGVVAGLEAAGVDKIVLLSHSGYNRDIEIARRVSGVDVIVGGHSNTFLANDNEKAAGAYPTWIESPNGKKTAIVQAYAYGKYLGRLDVVWDEAGDVASAEGAPILMEGTIAPDQAINQRIAELAGPIEELKAKRVGETSAPIDGARENCRAMECEMGNLVADAMLDRVADQGVQIAIQNGGGLRASIDSGEVTMGEVLTVLPFQNTLATFQIKGAGLMAALENGLSQVEEGAGRFPQVAGMRFSWSRAKPAGERLMIVEVADGDGWVLLEADATYTVVTNNYVRGGGDGYDVFDTDAMYAYDYGPGLEVVVADYIAERGSYTPYVDGRIREVE